MKDIYDNMLAQSVFHRTTIMVPPYQNSNDGKRPSLTLVPEGSDLVSFYLISGSPFITGYKSNRI